MSLKAKIEAVIYASEEPVTLLQLAGLLGEEAQTELDAAATAQGQLALNEESEAAADGAAAVEGDEDAEIADGVSDGRSLEQIAVAGGVSPELAARAAAEVRESLDRYEDQLVAALRDEPGATVHADAPADDEARLAVKDAKLRERALREYFRRILDELMADYANGDRGLEIREVAGGFRLATKPEYHDAVRGFVKSLKPPLKLSLQALETLAVVAYKQPVTAPEVSEIRGVDSGGVLGGLMTRKLVTTAGRKQVIGRPILYKTTKDFLVRFGLKDINELPSIEEFEKMAGELVDAEPMQEEIPMSETHETALNEQSGGPQQVAALHDTPEDMLDDKGGPVVEGSEAFADVEPMRDVHEAQADGVPDDAAERGSEETGA